MNTIDLFIQDFVKTNKLVNRHCDWATLVSRSLQDDGAKKVFSFESGGSTHYAVGEHLVLPDADWFRIELTHPVVADTEYRFDCLRMMHANTHVDLSVEPGSPLIVRLTTRHRGLINVLFVIRDGLALKNPCLV
jgi:hypothetical protein